MKANESGRFSRRTKAKTQLLRLLDEKMLSVRFVAAVAGDCVLNDEDNERLSEMKKRRGDRIYVDFLFALCHKLFLPRRAQTLWHSILIHKKQLSHQLGRTVNISVATLDYLTTVEQVLEFPVLVSEPSMATVAEVAVKDDLTRLYDHTTFLEKLREEVKRFERYGHTLSVLMMDLDHFKLVNDMHGHPVGDSVLRQMSKLINQNLRSVDIAARYGGEEFAICLPQTEDRDAYFFAERLRKQTEELFNDSFQVTVSIGIASAPGDGTSAEALIQSADQALYHSKQTGRNRSTAFRDIMS